MVYLEFGKEKQRLVSLREKFVVLVEMFVFITLGVTSGQSKAARFG